MMNLQNIGKPLENMSGDRDAIKAVESEIEADLRLVSSERPNGVLERIHDRGRMTAEERVRALCDEVEEIWFLGEYQGFDASNNGRNKPYRLGVICALGTVCGLKSIIIANDNTIAAGAWWPGTPEKIVRALEMAKSFRIPVFYLVECAGLYLPTQDKTFASSTGAGRIFEMQAELDRCGILQVAGVFGDCVAGGGYLPLLCHKIVMTEQASICIGGTSLNVHAKGTKGQRIGGPDMHVHQSGCVDCREPDDHSAIVRMRRWAGLMPTSAAPFFRSEDVVDPLFETDDLYDLIPMDVSRPFDMMEVLARLVDGGQGSILLGDVGPEVICVLSYVDGYPVVMIANQSRGVETGNGVHPGGVLYGDAVRKMRHVASRAREDGIPVVWIQDVSGFDIGVEAERDGLLAQGASMLQELAKERVPSLTILLRKASGAGYYSMCGAPFSPSWIVATPLTRLEVMSPETLASTLFDRKIQKLDDSLESHALRADLERSRAELIERMREASRPGSAAIRGDVDCIVPLKDLRRLIVTFVLAAYQNGGIPHNPEHLWSMDFQAD